MSMKIPIGARVRVDIPDQTMGDHHRYHGRHGTVKERVHKPIEDETGPARYLYRVRLDDESRVVFSADELRPPFDG